MKFQQTRIQIPNRLRPLDFGIWILLIGSSLEFLGWNWEFPWNLAVGFWNLSHEVGGA
jgi:hypothetical protein